MKSILEPEPDVFNPRQCFLCGRKTMLETHHIMAGSNRKLSTKYGLVVTLCHDCHTGKDGAQYNPEVGDYLKREAQMAFEEIYSHEEWMSVFRKNYLGKEKKHAEPSDKGFDHLLEGD